MEGQRLRAVSHEGPARPDVPVGASAPISRDLVAAAAVLDRRIVHVPDIARAVGRRKLAAAAGAAARFASRKGSVLAAPIVLEGRAVGVIALSRLRVHRFRPAEIALLRALAEHAAVAIESARRGDALADALAEREAVAEILGIIGRSTGDLQPVLDAVVANAARFCGALDTLLLLVEGGVLEIRAHHGSIGALPLGTRVAVGRGSVSGRALVDRITVQVEDLAEADEAEYPQGVALARQFGHRTTIATPLLREGEAIGVILLRRAEVRLFSEHEVAALRTFADEAVIAIENARLFGELEARNRDLTVALQQQTATAEILRVISSSPTAVRPVFDAIATAATTLCEADFSGLFRFDGDLISVEAQHGWSPEEMAASQRAFPQRPGRGSVTARAILDAAVVQVPDVSEDPDVVGALRAFRTVLSVPMIQAGRPVGAISVARRAARPFSAQQVALLQTFAEQAVIAIENVRLFTELEARNHALTVALDQQTATAEILRVISRSPADLQPVFDAIVDSAMRLFRAWSANVCQFDGELIHMVATRGGPPGTAGASIRGRFPTRPTAGLTVGRCILDRAVIRIDDVETDPDLVAATREMARTRGWRSALAVPMVREGEPVGALMVTRKAPGGFEAGSVELLQTFADQAVIAIENVRLFTELQARNRDLGEALERQTATAEILRVISGSPTDTAPVFQAIIERATRLSGADLGLLLRYEGGGVFRTAASAGAPAAFATDAQIPRRFERPFFREAGPWRATQIPDVRETEPYRRGDEFLRQSADTEGVRTLLIVPLVQEDRLIGSISIYRREVRPFTVAQVDLVRTFADQAVIAIENVRLFTELDEKNRAVTEALAQQTATSDILRVISRSPTDTQPVFDTIAASAMRLCDGHYGAVFLIEGEVLQFAAHHGFTPEGLAAFRRYYPMPVSAAPGLIARAIREMTVAHSADARTDIDTTAAALERYRALGSHALIAAPMVRDGRVIGTVNVAREKIEPFSDAQIALLQTFADQAVIAIENVRLFTELEHRNRAVTDALDRQTATAEVLRAISGSPTDAQPVFETIAASAVRLTGGVAGGVYEYDGRLVHLRAMHPRSWPQAERFSSFFPRPLAPDYAAGRVILHRALLHVGDLLHDPDTPATTRTWAEDLGLRSVLWVPLLREGEAIGVVSVVRSEPGRFSDDQVALLETFADQAVIAIGNVRLFTQLQARNLDLTEALERQTATAEILRVISEARGDARPVFEAIAKSALRLLQGFSVGVVRVVGDRLDPVAIEAGRPGSAAAVREAIAQMPRRRGAHLWDAIIDRAVKQIHDAEGEALDVDQRARARARGWRASIAVPMLEDGEPIGVIAVGREAPGPFSPQQVELLKTFADQAVIAIKNAGLLTDLRARTDELTRSVDQLTALGEVGQAVSSSLELETVLTTIVSRAVSLTGADDGVVFEYDEASGEFTHRAGTETGRVLAEARRVARIRKGEGVLGRTAITHEPVQVADITQQGLYESRLRETLLESGVRALLAVPMLREGRLLGGLVLSRNRPGEFPPATVELLRTFATQSALAIQNARLYRALAEQGRQLEVASRHKSEFLASMSHELRTPLNAILGFNEMILGEIYGEIPSDLREPLTEMQNSGRHLLRLINNVLDLSKIEAGRMELALSDYAAQDAVEQVRASLHPLAVDRGLELVTAVPADLPLAHGDAGRIMQCLTNLVGNAIKFTRQGRVEIAAELRDGLLVYRVSDTGIGIEPDRIATLFTEFRQADPTIASEFGGSGLGLSITRKFAEMHGGRVWVESEPGTGSSFFLAVPLRAAGGPTA